MGSQEILFEIPERIRLGLATGELQRFGGIIRDTHGRIVCHLKEINILNEVENISKNLSNIGNQLAGIQQMQALQLAGIGMVAAISVIGFVKLNEQITEIKHQLKDMQETLSEIKEIVKLIHIENIIQIANSYYRAVASFNERDFKSAMVNARDCSADINNYIENIPYDKLLNDENSLRFLSKLLVATMQCQIASARELGINDISTIINRYRNIFDLLYSIITNVKKKINKSLPSPKVLHIIEQLSKKDSYISILNKTLPICINHLENEQRFIELCPVIEQKELVAAQNKGKEYIVVVEPEFYKDYS